MKKESYCRWHEKYMRELTEHEQGQCEKYDWDCRECPYMIGRERKEHDTEGTD